MEQHRVYLFVEKYGEPGQQMLWLEWHQGHLNDSHHDSIMG